MTQIQSVTKSLVSGSGIIREVWRVDLLNGSSFASDGINEVRQWALDNTPVDEHVIVHARFDAIIEHGCVAQH